MAIEPDKDYVTLVTCTPYGVNTHRLLVRGVRVAEAETQTYQKLRPPGTDNTDTGYWQVLLRRCYCWALYFYTA